VFELYPAVAGPMVDLKNTPIRFRWWRRECPVYHPYVLVSYGHLMTANLYSDKNYLFNYLKLLELTDEVKFMLDSGGYQIAVRGLNIDPRDVLEWQLSNVRPGDFIIPLDYPSRPDIDTVENVETLAQKTARNVELWLKAVDKTGSNVSVLVPIHGMQEQTFKVWLKHIKEYVQLTGMVALGGLAFKSVGRGFYVKNFLVRAKALIDLGVKYMHVLGVGSTFMLAYLFFFSNYTGVKLSTDTSKLSKLVALGKVLFPGEPIMSLKKFFSRGDISVTMLMCHCPACVAFGNGYLVRSRRLIRERHYASTLHNLFQILQYYDKLSWYTSLNMIEDYLAKKYYVGSDAVNVTKEYLAKGGDINIYSDSGIVRLKLSRRGDLSKWL
jgi:tRNA-guanine family transglycosylase